jgi:hypothetical protein
MSNQKKYIFLKKIMINWWKELNAPPDPEVQERLRKLLKREAPWDN